MRVSGFVLITACLANALTAQAENCCKCDCNAYQNPKSYQPDQLYLPAAHPQIDQSILYLGGHQISQQSNVAEDRQIYKLSGIRGEQPGLEEQSGTSEAFKSYQQFGISQSEISGEQQSYQQSRIGEQSGTSEALESYQQFGQPRLDVLSFQPVDAEPITSIHHSSQDGERLAEQQYYQNGKISSEENAAEGLQGYQLNGQFQRKDSSAEDSLGNGGKEPYDYVALSLQKPQQQRQYSNIDEQDLGSSQQRISKVSTKQDNHYIQIEQLHIQQSVKDIGGHSDKEEDHHHHDKNAYYKFEYAVDDKKTHDIKSHKEERKGDVVQGEYSLVEEDGNVRTVKYSADWKNGFRAQIHNSKRKFSDL